MKTFVRISLVLGVVHILPVLVVLWSAFFTGLWMDKIVIDVVVIMSLFSIGFFAAAIVAKE